ncbi:MAG: glycosyl transferase family 1 [Acidimicrobiia bacterium]|nr:MAG: glycosyl transferase family 1 [Acidimicrobiia bacterium]
MPDSLTIVFFPEAAYGPTNNCVGIGKVLLDRGHRVVFAAEASYKGTLEPIGFEERLVRLADPPEGDEDPGQFWKDFIAATAPEFRKPTIEQLETFIKPTWQALLDGARYVEDQLVGLFEDVRPDVIVEDNVCAFPAVLTSGAPWVRIVSCNPLELKDPALPPTFSGYPLADRTGWDEFRAEYRGTHIDMWGEFNEWCLERGTEPLPELEFIHESPWLNMYLYPEIVDYPRSQPLGPTWHRLDSSVRTTDEPFEVPDELRSGPGALIYLSLGSLGSADVELMRRLVEVLADAPHRFIVSMGPRHDEYELADNMWGAEFLPQTSILPQVDLIITHGGNNTVTEGFHFGKPMIALPLFWDQYDNAQRLDETGFGVRLPTYTFEPQDLMGAIDRLLGDQALRAKLADNATHLQAHPGTKKAADLIERLGRTRQPVTR